MLRRTSTQIAGTLVTVAGIPISNCLPKLTLQDLLPPSARMPIDGSEIKGVVSSSGQNSNHSLFHNRVFTGCVMQHSSSDPNKFYISESSNDPDLRKEVRKANLQRQSSADGDQWLECTEHIRPNIDEVMHFTVDPNAVHKALLIPTATPVPLHHTASRRRVYQGRVRQHSNSDYTKFYIEELSKDPNLRQEVGDARDAPGRLGSVRAIQWLEATAATAADRPAIMEEVGFVIDENDKCKAIVTRRMQAEPATKQSNGQPSLAVTL